MEDLATEAMFACTLKAQREAELIIEEMEEAAQKKVEDIEKFKNELLDTIPADILDMPVGKLAELNFDISTLLTRAKAYHTQATSLNTSGILSHKKKYHGFDSEKGALRCLQNSAQAGNHGKTLKNRWNTPTKKPIGSASKTKISSQKKNRFFRGNSAQKENQLMSGKKLKWNP